MKGTGDSRQHILQKKGTGRVKAGTHPMWSGRGGHSPVSGGQASDRGHPAHRRAVGRPEV